MDDNEADSRFDNVKEMPPVDPKIQETLWLAAAKRWNDAVVESGALRG